LRWIGQLNPIDILSIEGACLRQLTGGRIRDLKRAFALIESSGAIHLMIASTDTDYFRWIQELQNAISRHGSGNDLNDDMMHELGLNNGPSDRGVSEHSSSGRRSIIYSGDNGNPQQVTKAGRLARAVQAAKATGQVVKASTEQAVKATDQAFKATSQAVAHRRRKNRESEHESVDYEPDNGDIAETKTHESSNTGPQIGRIATDVIIRARSNRTADAERIHTTFENSRASSKDVVNSEAARIAESTDAIGGRIVADHNSKVKCEAERADSLLKLSKEVDGNNFRTTVGDPVTQPADPANRRQQLRNKISGVGQVTKSRFGIAITAAKQKGKEVTDNARNRRGAQRTEELVASNPAHSLSPRFERPSEQNEANKDIKTDLELGSFQQIGDVDNDLEGYKQASRLNDAQQTHELDAGPWTCSACTYPNHPLLFCCEMCETARDSSASYDGQRATNKAVARDKVVSVDDAAIQDIQTSGPGDPSCLYTQIDQAEFCDNYDDVKVSLNVADKGAFDQDTRSKRSGDDEQSVLFGISDIDSGSLTGNRLSMRERVSSALRRNSRSNENGQGTIAGGFSFSRNAALNQSVSGAPDPVRLCAVTLAGHMPPVTDPFFGELIKPMGTPMKRVEGVWLVRASIFSMYDEAIKLPLPISVPVEGTRSKLESNVELPDHESALENNEYPKEFQNDTRTNEANSVNLKKLVGELGDPTTQVATDRLMVTVKLQVYSEEGLKDSSNLQSAAVVLKTLSDVLALHTMLSESMSVEFKRGNDGRAPSNREICRSLTSCLGLTSLETVRFTGNILSGLLQFTSSSTGISESFKNNCGKSSSCVAFIVSKGAYVY
jgi:hypothetical protein